MVDQYGWCRACGGIGYVDEDQAKRLGFTIDDGRTEICPVCLGTGELEHLMDRRATKALMVAAWAVLSAVMIGGVLYLEMTGRL